MLDVPSSRPPLPTSPAARNISRPNGWCPELALDFELGAERTLVRGAAGRWSATASTARRLRLNASGLHILDVRLDGETVNYWFENDVLRIPVPGDSGVVETVVAIAPRTNTQLMGLYESGGMLCTQCEAEGFRRITPFPDRPDVLSRYRVRMSGDKARLSGPALQRQSGGLGRGSRRPGRTGRNGTTPSPSPAICSRSSPAIWSPTATASSPVPAARSTSPSGCATAICRAPSMPWPASRRR